MQDLFAAVGEIAIALFALASMLSVGLGNSLSEIVGPLRHASGVLRALIANFVLVPALALFVLWLVPLEPSQENGLLLVSAAAGAPFLIKLSETAGSPLGLTATLLVLLLPSTIVYLPLVILLLLPGTAVSAQAIAIPLALTMLLPLLVGLLVRQLSGAAAGWLRPILQKVSTVALIVVVLSLVLAHYEAIIMIGWGAPLAALLIILGAFGIGYLLGGNDPDRREVLGLGTAQRNIAAGTISASQGLEDPEAVITVVVASLLGLAVLFPIARALWRRELQRHPLPR